MDTVRVPVSVVPYEDSSTKYQRQLGNFQQDVSESADMDEVSVKAVSEGPEDSVNQVSETSVSEEGAQRNENTTASKEGPKQDQWNSE